ncbi:uncharacterized protein EI97DRAFT_450698 [Westerdykella ornata]|uniref:C2H2-type domain-containing protein n=1 Tax=Westerdykella ornata TaxID=318751 RepID=A0A6A6JH66_WESOR|nr:uncharacterized protein EI97DRAFT_450698 [Westerdykella ornata]KAF2275901.1 hypothetical protein EI97DRAFT_450698 [Westerdykella ornata]
MANKRKETDGDEGGAQKRFRRALDDQHDAGRDDDPFANDTPAAPDPFIREGINQSDGRSQWLCTYTGCEYRCDRLAKIQNHVRVHTGERPFVCTYGNCDRSFTRKDKLTQHVKNVHGEEAPRPHACTWEGCTKSFGTKQHLKEHIKSHERLFYCTGYPPCTEAFRKQKTLDSHIAQKHLKINPWACTFIDAETGEKCTKSYQTEGSLRLHTKTCHNGKVTEVFFCVHCPAPGAQMETFETEMGIITQPTEPLRFATKEELLNHEKVHHPPECMLCNRKFASQMNLDNHVAVVHGDPKSQPQLPCPYPDCKSVFKKRSNLNTHIWSFHEKRKNFKTDLKAWDGHNACGAAYASKSSLEQHVRRDHLKMPNRKQMRKMRKSRAPPPPSALRLLTGVGFDGGRTITCLQEGCQHTFFRDYDLRRHMRAEHDMEPHDIEARILERNAQEGGEFWVRRGEDLLYESAETISSVLAFLAMYYDDGLGLSRFIPLVSARHRLSCFIEHNTVSPIRC